MATIVATAASASANSYLLLADAETYATERLQVGDWDGASTDEKNRALIEATRWLDHFDFAGERSTEAQALEWPRIGTYTRDGYEYDTDTIPAFIEQATFELALQLLKDNAASKDTLGPTGLEAFNRAKVGPMEVEVRHANKAGDLPDSVRSLIRHVLRAGGMSVELLRA